MSGAEKESTWKIVTAIAGLAISLFGNIIQYESLKTKQTEIDQKNTELRQSQAKIDASDAAAQRRQDSIDSQMASFQSRMKRIDDQLQDAENDNRRAQTATALGRAQDAASAHALFEDSIKRHFQLLEEKKQLQQEIDLFQRTRMN